jgi:hypothetical protein
VSTKRVDLFPAIIFLAEPGSFDSSAAFSFTGPKPQRTRKVDRARVAIFNEALYIVVDSPEGPKIIFRERITDYTTGTTGPASNPRTHHATTESGKLAVFGKDLNCGCGSRLRSWSPFGATAYSTSDPTE